MTADAKAIISLTNNNKPYTEFDDSDSDQEDILEDLMLESYCSVLEKHVDQLLATNDVLSRQIQQLEQQRSNLLLEIERDCQESALAIEELSRHGALSAFKAKFVFKPKKKLATHQGSRISKRQHQRQQNKTTTQQPSTSTSSPLASPVISDSEASSVSSPTLTS
eukprot:c24571_g1_i1.p1 GENE.c24571_g1_i1~~c24571_g1_i1.p1  ORF type:complete len:165 (-),score=44.08 c24571_g1_i1:328-822(-)